ncbi:MULTISPECIES: hypothetical protein [Auritidibacter]|uniref:Lipoprotein n=1 Tax=Auritidibacter ignavus TaxID=678932 RepID=A0AAJ6AFG2_9MICC|nr:MULTISPECIES: hypothetical protein [Auritidibacter]PXA79709.1 hypothetical protein DCC25_07905 [Auritidibacter sp. NML120636]WGH80777.1 hypothetical protein QDX25_08195 [Auritidibacter ignavus]WGH83024.1 hypothetical protein QDX20_06955 [Auritidibacter ignavus]WGH85898.1 hypothetical protein QDX24_10045 [Auritidibacter ignavus]WGH88185.1 hypothetical protein QDX22_10050 [Auritidibacter ignavus]
MTRKITRSLMLIGLPLALAMSGCAVLEDTVDGVMGRGPGSPEPTPLSPSLSVTVEVESDSPVSGELSISIDGATDSQSVEEGSVDLPYSAVFDVPSDAPFPYRGSRVEVSAAQDASWIECRILMDEKVVASHRAEGSNARAVCERNLRLGPS